MVLYPAFIHQDPGKSGYGVSFPDFPGCISDGETIEAARAMAEEALELHIEGMLEDRQPIPSPSAIEDLTAELRASDVKAIVMVPASLKAKAVRINITVPEDILKDIDQHAQAHGLTRSGFLLRAAREALKEEPTA